MRKIAITLTEQDLLKLIDLSERELSNQKIQDLVEKYLVEEFVKANEKNLKRFLLDAIDDTNRLEELRGDINKLRGNKEEKEKLKDPEYKEFLRLEAKFRN